MAKSTSVLTIWCWLCILTQSKSHASTRPDNVTSPNVLYYGFFFDEPAASSIKLVMDKYLNSSLATPDFDSFLKNISQSAGVEDALNYFTKPLDPNTGDFDPLYHVTAKYCGDDQVSCAEYEDKFLSKINQTYEMHLVGYVLTNRTFGIRVNLTEEQLELFDNEDTTQNFVSSILDFNANFDKLSASDFPGLKLQENPPPPIQGVAVTRTKAHITVGCGPGIPAVTTGPDVLQVIKLESCKDEDDNPCLDSSAVIIEDPVAATGNNLTIRKYSNPDMPLQDFVFVIYPHVKLIANATLRPYYQPIASAVSMLSYNFSNLCLLILSFILNLYTIV